ncbi:MAG: alpha/beta fold hydrolase [Acidobacteriota bacterium]
MGATRVDKGIGVLNAIVGDHLDRRRNDLAIDMELSRGAGTPKPKLCVLVHGLGCTEDVFEFPGQKGVSYGALLERDLGYTPVAVRYNTGLAIARNGRLLATRLDDLVAAHPIAVEEIALIGHSMGGLVVESACLLESRWAALVRHVVCLGTPHDGADLEKLTRTAADVLGAVRSPIARLLGNVLNLRSRGVKDLGLGAAHEGAGRAAWRATARHYVVAGTLTGDPGHPVSRALGDSLVRVPGPETPDLRVFPGVHHVALAHDDRVYEQLRAWLGGA